MANRGAHVDGWQRSRTVVALSPSIFHSTASRWPPIASYMQSVSDPRCAAPYLSSPVPERRMWHVPGVSFGSLSCRRSSATSRIIDYHLHFLLPDLAPDNWKLSPGYYLLNWVGALSVGTTRVDPWAQCSGLLWCSGWDRACEVMSADARFRLIFSKISTFLRYSINSH